jgi:hypothetical protein
MRTVKWFVKGHSVPNGVGAQTACRLVMQCCSVSFLVLCTGPVLCVLVVSQGVLHVVTQKQKVLLPGRYLTTRQL